MEQATNQFNKGLLLDTHPMVQGNDTLTDCLNGTLITMNGNEVILLNDMGNRRVNRAFLPSGYLPVGMKEYGGIIYVASYNPITNKSQIGCFPSPQRKIDLSDEDDIGNASIDITNSEIDVLIESVPDTNLGINVLVRDSIMLPLTDDISLRAGDKFVVYASGLSNISSNITNYNNIGFDPRRGDLARTPKNRRYTFQIGILNSQNEFVDITKTLARWKNNQIYNLDSSYSDIYKFNYGYFIPDSFTNPDLEETVDDSKLIIKRQIIEANTYAYKLIGPMYLKISLNHIENFNYNIYGVYENVNTAEEGQEPNYLKLATLWIEGYLTYNCYDGANPTTGIQDVTNQDYYIFETGIPEFYAFGLINETEQERNAKCSTYNINNNIYNAKIIKKYTEIVPNITDTDKYEYVIGVQAIPHSLNNGIYIKELSAKGVIDLALLGSGKAIIKGWRFYNNLKTRTTILTFSFDAYPKYGLKFENLRFNFTDIGANDNESNFTYPENGMSLYNGRQTIVIDWNEDNIKFEERKTYGVTATYDIVNSETGEIIQSNVLADDPVNTNQEYNRWLLTTELFNEFYSSSAGIDDFCNVPTNDLTNPNYLKFYDKMKINTFVNGNIINNSTKGEMVSQTGGLTSSNSQNTNISWNVTNEYNINMLLDPTSYIGIVNELLYPDYVAVNETNKHKIQISSANRKFNENIDANNSNFKELLEIVEGDENNLTYASETLYEEKHFDGSTSGLDVGSNSIKGKILYHDLYKGNYRNNQTDHYVREFENVFDCISEIIAEASPTGSNHTECGVISNYNARGDGHDDNHLLVVCHGVLGPITSLPSNADVRDGWVNLDYAYGDSPKTLKISSINNKEDVYNYFNRGTSEGLMFTFLGVTCSSNVNKIGNTDNYDSGSLLTSGTYYRVWWKATNGEWAIFFDGLNSPVDVYSSSNILGLLKHDYIYCMYDTFTNYIDSTTHNPVILIYSADKNFMYNKLYSIPETFMINYEVPFVTQNPQQGDITSLYDILDNVEIEGINNNSLLESVLKIGNLKFTSENLISTIKPTKVTINLKSSLKFLDTIDKFDPDHIMNIEKSGALFDSNNEPLNINNIYYKDNNNLIRVTNNLMVVDRNEKSNGKNILLYNGKTFGSPLYRYNISQGNKDDSRTIVDFSGLRMVDKDV